jgi:hypothetical protein
MQPDLDRGKLRPPASIKQAHERLQLLNREISNIDEQLADAVRRKRLGAQYFRWCGSAEHARQLFLSERRQLKTWLEEAEHPLFRAAYELLKTLRRQEVDFDPPELELINKLDNHFKE